MGPGTLFIVPTPIGNLEDITLRALRILGEADLIACEDTRHTLKLLTHYGIQKRLVSFFTYNQFRRIPQIIGELRSGKRVALVSDSGTPGISDPGFFLVAQALKDGITVVPLPGPNAAVTALVASGLPTDGFVFLGFLKKKAGKLKRELREAAALGKTVVFYESPHRIRKTLTVVGEEFEENTPVVLARELTKQHEEIMRGSLSEIREKMEARDVMGEFVVLISPKVKVTGHRLQVAG